MAYVIQHTNLRTGVKTVCEIDGGRCYEAYRSADAAHKAADEFNREYGRHGNSHYSVIPAPADLLLALPLRDEGRPEEDGPDWGKLWSDTSAELK